MMDERKVEFFLRYVMAEAHRAQVSLEKAVALSRVVETRGPGVQLLENDSVLDALRLGLHRAAGVSRVFWPARASTKEAQFLADGRAELLRSLLSLPEEKAGHILARRGWRDFIEHLDEKIDSGPVPSASSMMIVEIVEHNVEGRYNHSDIPIVYRVDDRSMFYFGSEYPIDGIIDALRDVGGRATAAFNDHAQKYWPVGS